MDPQATHETLLEMLGCSEVSPEALEDACVRLRRNGRVTPDLIWALRALATQKASASEERRIRVLARRNTNGRMTESEKDELSHLVRWGEWMSISKARALMALKLFADDAPEAE